MIEYNHLLGQKFNYGRQDCYTLLCQFYEHNFGISFPNFTHPKDFWEHGLDLYMNRYRKCGFYLLDCHPSEYQIGDVILCAVDSTVANHVGIIVENGNVLHHLYNRLSMVEPYRLLLRNTTVAVLRHKDVKFTVGEIETNILDLVSPSVKRKLHEHLGSSASL